MSVSLQLYNFECAKLAEARRDPIPEIQAAKELLISQCFIPKSVASIFFCYAIPYNLNSLYYAWKYAPTFDNEKAVIQRINEIFYSFHPYKVNPNYGVLIEEAEKEGTYRFLLNAHLGVNEKPTTHTFIETLKKINNYLHHLIISTSLGDRELSSYELFSLFSGGNDLVRISRSFAVTYDARLFALSLCDLNKSQNLRIAEYIKTIPWLNEKKLDKPIRDEARKRIVKLAKLHSQGKLNMIAIKAAISN